MRVHGRSAYTSLARVRAALAGLSCVLSHRFCIARDPFLTGRGNQIVASVKGAGILGGVEVPSRL
jgi:hypothetical protein